VKKRKKKKIEQRKRIHWNPPLSSAYSPVRSSAPLSPVILQRLRVFLMPHFGCFCCSFSLLGKWLKL